MSDSSESSAQKHSSKEESSSSDSPLDPSSSKEVVLPTKTEETKESTTNEETQEGEKDMKDDDSQQESQNDEKIVDENEASLLPVNCFTMKYASFVYDYPWVIILLVIAFVAGFSGWMFGAFDFTFTADISNYRWSETEITEKWDAFASASVETFYSEKEKTETVEKAETQSTPGAMGAIIWERKGKNILDIDVFRTIWDAEDELYQTKDFEKYCWKPYADGTFIKQSDIAPNGCFYFKSLVQSVKQVLYAMGKTDVNSSTFTQQQLNMILTALPESEKIRTSFLGRDCTPSHLETSVMRTMFNFGFPLEGYNNINDRFKEQQDKQTEFGFDFVKPIEKIQEEEPMGLKGFDYVPGTIDSKVSGVVMKQVLWLVGSFSVAIVVVVCHLWNPLISIMGVLATFLSIPAAIAFSYAVVGIHHFDALNVLGLFLICGVGTDSIFIYYDFLRQSADLAVNHGISAKRRLASAAQHGMFATFVSTMTTAICFISLITSGARVIRFFGVFCFFLMVFDWLFAATFYVASLAIWVKYYEKLPEKDDETPRIQESNNQKEPEEPLSINPLTAFYQKPPIHKTEDTLPYETFNIWEKFFHEYVAPIVYHYRLIIVILCVILSAVMGYYAFQMVGKVEMQFLDDEHPLQHGFSLMQTKFATQQNDFSFVYVWGVNPKIKATFSQKLTAHNFGTAKFVDIDFSKEENQQFLLDACDLVDTDAKNFTDKTFGENYMTCPMRALKLFCQTNNIPFPIPPQLWDTAMAGFKKFTAAVLGTAEAMLDPGTSQKDLIGFDYKTGKLKFVALKATMKLPETLASEDLKPLYDQLQDFEKMVNEKAPKDLKGGYTTSLSWVQMDTQDNLVSSTVIGIITSSAFAVLVVFLSSLSFAYTAFFVFSLACVILTIMGILERMGWGIGLSEAVMLIISSGFCCDYIVHTMLNMANNHVLSRYGRLQQALTTFCTPVFLAFCTTAGSAVFLYGCDVIIFPPFATFLLFSAVFGLMHGFIVLPAFAAMCGPKIGDNLNLLCKKERVEPELSEIE